jgi:DNA-binding protein HU-beta
MNKEKLAEGIAQKTGMNKTQAMKFLESFIASLEEAILAGERVTLSGFGTFELTQHKERTVINPATRQPMKIPPQTTARFRASRNLKAIIRQARE